MDIKINVINHLKKLKIIAPEDLFLLKNWTELAQGNSDSDKVKILTRRTQRTGFQWKNNFRPDGSEKEMRYD
jgi:hypothetical protein